LFLPVPELYDPYTGRKFAPEEDPLEPIESAYRELKDIVKSAHLKAASLRKKAKREEAKRETAKRATAKRETAKRATAKSNNKTHNSNASLTHFNAGLRIRIPKNKSTRRSKKVQLPPTGHTLDYQENLFS
jgi:septal ring factor EnvC (AmiA/AmiB activator)